MGVHLMGMHLMGVYLMNVRTAVLLDIVVKMNYSAIHKYPNSTYQRPPESIRRLAFLEGL
jgi:hypothetical protein